jgi:hypothetical protein
VEAMGKANSFRRALHRVCEDGAELTRHPRSGRITGKPEVELRRAKPGPKSAWRKCRRQKRGTSQDLREARFRFADHSGVNVHFDPNDS